MVLTFAAPPVATDGTLDCSEISVTNGTCTGVSVSGNDMIVSMTFNKNACVTVTAQGIAGLAGSKGVSVVTREGDVAATPATNILDLNAIKNQLNKPVDANTFRFDVNVNGSINI